MANALKKTNNEKIDKLINRINNENKMLIEFEKEYFNIKLKIKNCKNVFDSKELLNSINKLEKKIHVNYAQKELSKHAEFIGKYKDPNVFNKDGALYKVTDKELAHILQNT